MTHPRLARLLEIQRPWAEKLPLKRPSPEPESNETKDDAVAPDTQILSGWGTDNSQGHNDDGIINESPGSHMHKLPIRTAGGRVTQGYAAAPDPKEAGVRRISTTPIGPAPPTTTFPKTGLQRGERGPYGQSYCPVIALSRFPYKFIGQADSELVAGKFFNAGKFWVRQWDIFYIYPPTNISEKPLFLVPLEQFFALLKEINSVFKHLDLRIDDPYYKDIGLVLEIPHPFVPRFLGRSTHRDKYNSLTEVVPGKAFKMIDEKELCSPNYRITETFRTLMDAATDLSNKRSKADKAKKKAERAALNQVMLNQLRRAERYLGLRPKTFPNSTDKVMNAEEAKGAESIPPIDPNLPAPWPFESDVVFISVDVEAYEHNHNLITEIGVSTLDTRDIINIPPGKQGENWLEKFRNRHFRIKEYANLVNKNFIIGCPDRFEFGTSEFISLHDAPKEIAACFRPPYSKVDKSEETENEKAESKDGVKLDEEKPSNTILPTYNLSNISLNPETPLFEKPRTLILVGHDAKQDIKYLSQAGYNLLNASLLEVLDTASIYRAWTRDMHPRSLGTVLLDLDIPGWHLHNAGNDARYTLQALVALSVRSAEARAGEAKAKDNERLREQEMKRMKEKVFQAMEICQDEKEVWELPDGDGGVPLKPPSLESLTNPEIRARKHTRTVPGDIPEDPHKRGTGAYFARKDAEKAKTASVPKAAGEVPRTGIYASRHAVPAVQPFTPPPMPVFGFKVADLKIPETQSMVKVVQSDKGEDLIPGFGEGGVVDGDVPEKTGEIVPEKTGEIADGAKA